ncbi:MAG: acetylornithine deacetylase [Actinopolymorphaceae bacterium]
MQAIDILQTLVGFDTTSRNSNRDLVAWATEFLESAGARIRLTYDDSGTKANVLASFDPPDVAGGILLSGHTDVVPVDGQNWSTDPFTLTVRDGRLHGRGTTDMKGFIAACLAEAPRWKGARLVRPIHLALTYDEETGCQGVPRLIADLVAHHALPAVALVGEPTRMRISDEHRGYLAFRTVLHGRAAHSSDPRSGVNAIAAAAEFVVSLDDAAPSFAGTGPEPTTVSVGTINGGSVINVVPARCEVRWEIRPTVGADIGPLRQTAKELTERRARPGIVPETEEIMTVPPLRPEATKTAVEIVHRLGGELPTERMPFGTEAGYFQAAGIPTVVCGPGSIEQAHQPDEWLEVDQFEAASRLLSQVTHWAELGDRKGE